VQSTGIFVDKVMLTRFKVQSTGIAVEFTYRWL